MAHSCRTTRLQYGVSLSKGYGHFLCDLGIRLTLHHSLEDSLCLNTEWRTFGRYERRKSQD